MIVEFKLGKQCFCSSPWHYRNCIQKVQEIFNNWTLQNKRTIDTTSEHFDLTLII